MERVIKILIQYEQANFAQRIYLFLQYPGMRDAFVEIERKEYCSLKILSICEGTA
jgi:hypothetical protein